MAQMGKFRYVTNRTLKNGAGEENGRIKVLVKTGSDTAQVDYICPECRNGAHAEQEWKRPFIICCSECGTAIKIPRLKDDIKKDKKKR